MKRKKAALEVQFNWIFVMVAGALILVFFFGVVQKQRELSQAKISNSLLTNLESLATGAGVSKGTVQTVDLPNIEIDFGCTEECLCTYAIEDVRKEYRDKIIFAPSFIQGAQVILWTLDWKIPFRVTNFVYATTANDKYYFVYDNPNSALKKMLNRTIPPEVNADFVTFNQYMKIKYENHNSVKFIFVETASQPSPDLGIDRSFRKADVGGLYINSAGDAIFYDKATRSNLVFEQKPSSYFGEPLIYGAIFSADSNTYECNVISALSRLKNLLGVYIARTENLDEENNINNFCIKGYTSMNLEDLRNVADTASRTPQNLKSMGDSVSTIKTQNDELLRGSCPLLY
jgi:hypothetical protein